MKAILHRQIRRIQDIPTLRRWIFNLGALFVILAVIIHYVCRYFKLLGYKQNSDLYWILSCAGMSLIFASHIKRKITFKNDVSGYGAILFAYISPVFLGDYFLSNWFHAKSIYIMVGALIIVLLWTFFRHLKSRNL